MNQPARVRDGKSARHFAQQPRLLLEVELRGKAVERIALNEFHHDRRRIGFIEHREHGHDGGITERGGVARFIEHAAAHLCIGVAAQDFDGHAAVEFLVMRGIDHAQTAFAQLAFDAEARQSRQLLLMFGRRAALLAAQFAHVQSGLDPLAGFLAHRFGQLLRRKPRPARCPGGSSRAETHRRATAAFMAAVPWVAEAVNLDRTVGWGGGGWRKSPRVIVRAKEGGDFAMQRGVVPAPFGEPTVARAAWRQFNRLGEDPVSSVWRFVHRGLNLARHRSNQVRFCQMKKVDEKTAERA